MFRVVIPARYASTRLPGKPLRTIAGRPMIHHVLERAGAAGAREVVVATDDERIAAACRACGADVEMTSAAHPSGTDRLAEVAVRRGWADDDIIVNVQGDEPLLASANVAQVAALLAATPQAAIATLATPVLSHEEFLDANAVKVVCDAGGLALYFSRAPLPWPRDAALAAEWGASAWGGALRHIGIYAYRVAGLRALAAMAPTPLETTERLEQLRALENGLRIAVAVAVSAPGPGVDTEADLARVEALLAGGRR
ncbi:MAG: 3-deoxy-manno-octulosonate cytidylyltransferase [Pseudomonadota bacterium]